MRRAASQPATIAIIVERRHLDKQAFRETCLALEEADCRVRLIVPDAGQLHSIPSEAPAWDAVLSRGRDLAGLGLLTWAAVLGVTAINQPQSIELVRNKIAMQSVLLQHALPLPATWFGSHPSVFRKIPAGRFPLVVKPFDGDGARDLALLTGPGDVELIPVQDGRRTLYLAQEFLETDGSDLKLYGIGRDVWAVRKPSPVRFAGPGPAELRPVEGGELLEPDAQLRDLALTCGRALGLELWGVDVAVTPRGPVVVEVNDFPTYSAVPGAGTAIAEHVLRLVGLKAVLREAGRECALSLVREVS